MAELLVNVQIVRIYHLKIDEIDKQFVVIGMDRSTLQIGIQHLKYVIAAAEQGSFRMAAAAVGVHPSVVSRRVRDIEDEIEAALFVRHSGGVRLTYAGDLFLLRARGVIQQIASAKKEIRAIGRGERGVVRVGICSSLASGFIAELIEAHSSEQPNIQLTFFEGCPAEHISAIRKHQLDVAFLTDTPITKGCEVKKMWTECVHVAMPSGDPLSAQECVTWDDLRHREFVVSEIWPGPAIHDILIQRLSDLEYRPLIRVQGVYRDNLMQIVASGGGLTLTTEAEVATQAPKVAYRQLDGEQIDFSAIWSLTNDNPAFRRFLSLARKISARRIHNMPEY